MLARNVGNIAGEHSCQLIQPFRPLQSSHPNYALGFTRHLFESDVQMGNRRDLRQMGDAQDPVALREAVNELRHTLRGLAVDSGIYLVQNDQFLLDLVCQNFLQSQQDAGQLTTGSHI